MSRARALLAIVTVAVLAAGCGSEEPPIVADSDTRASAADIEAYFSAIASYRISDLEHAVELTESGSVAELYAGFQLATARAAQDAGKPIAPSEAKDVGGGYRACGGTGRADSCVAWADIVSRDGKLVSFTVNNESLVNRLTAGDSSGESAGDLAEVTFLYSYKSVQNATANLFVALQVTAASEGVFLDSTIARYRAPDGTESLASDPRGPREIAAGSSATIVIPFAGAEPGGVVTLPLSGSDQSAETEVELATD